MTASGSKTKYHLKPPAASKDARIQIFDTTLRDGTQSEHISYSLTDKLEIAHALDELGVDYI